MKFKGLPWVLFLLIAGVLWLAPGRTVNAASHTWSGGANGLFSNAGNWSAGGVPTLAETNALVFPAGATRFTVTNDIGALKVSAITLSGTNYVVRGASTISIENNLININAGAGRSNTIECALSFSSVGTVSVGDNGLLVLSGALSSANDLIKYGNGDLYFKGAASNPLSGKLYVSYGTLHFQKTGGASPYNGNQIEIGTGNPPDLAYLELHSSDSIPDGATLATKPTGVLRMNGFSDVVGAVTMEGGIIDGSTGGSVLRVDGDLTLTPRVAGTNGIGQLIFESPTLWGEIQFGGVAATINVTTNTAKIEAVISEYSTPSPINKIGPGTLTLAAANTFVGQFNVVQGTVFAQEAGALGTTAGNTVVSNGASLKIPAGVTISEPMVLFGSGVSGGGALQLDAGGNTTASGLITVSNLARVFVPAAQQLQLSGVVAGPGGIEKSGPGDLLIGGVSANTFSGASFVNGGKMLLGKPTNTRAIGSVTVTNGAQLHFNNSEVMDNTGVLSLYTGAVVNLTNRNETIAGLNLGGGTTADTGTGTLTLLGNVFVGVPYSATNTLATIRGNLSLGGALRTVEADHPSYTQVLNLDCAISDGAGVGGLNLKIGPIGLLRSNSFTGPVWLNGAACVASNAFAFGAPGGNIFATNASITLAQSNMVVSGESLTCAGFASVGFFGVGSNVWNGNISIVDSNTVFYFSGFNRPESKSLTINGAISGKCDLFYVDNGKLILTAANSFSGPTVINGWGPFYQPGGQLVARHANALGTAGQDITIYQGGTLRLELPNGAAISGKALNYVGETAPDEAFLVHAGASSNSWNGPISMTGGAGRISGLDYNGTLVLNTVITGGVGLAKDGIGTVILAGNGTNQLSQIIGEHGMLRLAQTNGYAVPTGDVVVQGTDYITIDGINYSAPAIIMLDRPDQLPPGSSLNLVGPEGYFNLNGQNVNARYLSGAGSLYIGSGMLTFSNAPAEISSFSGAIRSEYSARTNLIKSGGGALVLCGPSFGGFANNDWYLFDAMVLSGTVQMLGGQLQLTNGIIGSLQLATGTVTQARSTPVTVPNLPGYFKNGLRLGSLSGSGDFGLGDGAWVYVGTDDSSSTFNGTMDGSYPAKLVKTGTGAFTLAKDGLGYTGSALVENGTLFVNAAFNCDVLVQTNLYDGGGFATLGGTGQVQNVTLNGLRARISPGATTNTPSYGRLRVHNLTMWANTSYKCEIGGTSAGMNLDQIDADGGVTLLGGFADFTAFGAGVVSNQYAVLKSIVPVFGTFLGDPEGDTILPAAGRVMKITYLLSGGKEVTLIEQPGAPLSNLQISDIKRQPNGTMTINGTGVIGATYFVEANTNLNTTNWISLGSINGDFNGGLHFTDMTATNFPQRFYRFRLQ